MNAKETTDRFECFGSWCELRVIGAGGDGSGRDAGAEDAVALGRRELLAWHDRFSRFLPDSELSLLNDDPREVVPVGALMARFAQAVRDAGSLTGGLVDATLIDEIESAGYTSDLHDPLPLATALELAPPRKPAAASSRAHWRLLQVDLTTPSVTRPPGVKLDSGGLAKGLFADVLGERLAGHPSFAIDCAGDLSIGGADAMTRPLEVESPFDGRTLHTFETTRTGVATSGIGRRSWLDANGRPAHHLLDPASGEPAFTGIVQVTALAPSALLAEVRAKAAILSGPRVAPAWLPDGGVIVFDDGSHRVIEPPPVISLSQLSAFAKPPTRARRER
ncbi:MAG: FAD:protein transferase [Solirubrobacterales bacterium]|nr:FAD:protein transferase [Solirubrobacterales bacterium]